MGDRNLARMVRDADGLALDTATTWLQFVTNSTSFNKAPSKRAWSQVGIDIAEWLPPNCQKKYKFILCMDLATKQRWKAS